MGLAAALLRREEMVPDGEPKDWIISSMAVTADRLLLHAELSVRNNVTRGFLACANALRGIRDSNGWLSTQRPIRAAMRMRSSRGVSL